MQPAEAQADPADWAGGELQPSSQPAESHGSAPSTNIQNADDTADSAATTAVADRAEYKAAGSNAGGQGKEGDEADAMQVDSVEKELESSMLATGDLHADHALQAQHHASHALQRSLLLSGRNFAETDSCHRCTACKSRQLYHRLLTP